MGNIIQKQFEMILYSTDSEDVTVNAIVKDENRLSDIPHVEKYLGEEKFREFFSKFYSFYLFFYQKQPHDLM